MLQKRHNKLEFLFNSIFIMIGLAYDWNLDQLAEFYGVTPGHFELWLSMMGFPKKQITALAERSGYNEGHCVYCGVKVDKDPFCSDNCFNGFLNNRHTLMLYVDEKVVPNSIYKNTRFDIDKREIIYD